MAWLTDWSYRRKLTIDRSKLTVYDEDITSEGTASADSYYNSSQTPEKAIDDDTGTQWSAGAGGAPYWWKIDYGSGNSKTIRKFSIQARNDSYWEEIPTDFLFQGSNNDSDWDTIAAYAGLDWSQNQYREFEVHNNTSYRYYRFWITGMEDSTNTSLLEVQMFEHKTLTDLKIPVVLESGTGGNFDFNDMLPDGKDLRFTEEDGISLLDYEIEDLLTESDGNGLGDSSPSEHTVLAFGNAVVNSADKVFGNSSVAFDGSGDYLSVTDHADLDLGSDDFVVDFRVKFNSTSGNQGFFGRETGGSSYFYCAWESGVNIRFRDYGGSYDSAFAWSPSAGTWYHIAIVRSGNSIRCFVDGTQIGSTQTFSGSFIDRSVPLYIGSSFSTAYHLNGRIDEFRLSKGTDREWTSNFTPPSSAYSSDEYTKLLMHYEIEYGDIEKVALWTRIPNITPNVYSADIASGSTANADAQYSVDYSADKAIDGDESTRWYSGGSGSLPRWLTFDLGSGNEKTVQRFNMMPRWAGSWCMVKDFEVWGSNLTSPDGNTDNDWTKLFTGQNPNEEGWQTFDFDNDTAYRHYRITITNNWNSTVYISIHELSLHEIESLGEGDFYLYYGGGSGTLDAQDKAGTWLDYDAVWHMNAALDGTSGELEDSTQNGHDGTGQGIYPTKVDGILGKAEYGSGSGSYITAPDDDNLDLTGDFEITWKMKWLSSISNGSILGKSAGGGSNPKWIINYGDLASGAMAFHGGGSTVSWSWTPTADTWYHCRILRTGNNWKFYVDGVQVGSTIVSAITIPNTTQNFHFFTDGESWRWFNGILDEVRLRNGSAWDDEARTNAEYYADSNNLLSYGDEEVQLQEETIIETDEISISDDIDFLISRTISQEDTLTLSDDITAENYKIEEQDSIKVSDNALLSSQISNNLEDTINLNDEISVHQSLPINEQDNISLNDDIELIRNVQKTVNEPEGIILTDDIDLEILSQSNENIVVADDIETFKFLPSENQDEISLHDDLNAIRAAQRNIIETETISLSDDILVSPSQETVDESEGIELVDEINVFTTTGTAKYASKILSFNPLIIVTDSNPMKVIKVDITNPALPTWEIFTFGELKYAKDVIYNEIFDLIYVACADGKILQIDASDFNSTEIINTGDNNDLTSLASVDSFHRLYAGTDESTGEVIYVDQADLGALNLDIQCLSQFTGNLDLDIRATQGGIFKTDIQCLSTESGSLSLDIRVISDPFDEIALNPIKQTDFHVHINGSEINDVLLDSIKVYHTIGEESTATFTVKRRHDELNKTISGSSSQITNQNEVKVYIQGRLEFSGKVARIRTNSENETVEITAKGSEKDNEKRVITLPLSSVNQKLHPYHCLVDNEDIYNPIINEDDEDPEFYFGVKVALGTETKQSVSRWIYFHDVSEDVIMGDFQPRQNWTYFWFARATNYLTGIKQGTSRYVGTSPASLTGDVWEIDSMNYRMQREFGDVEKELGTYKVGTAPYKTINARNGRKLSADKWQDRSDGLYRSRDSGYDYVKYAKKIAKLEYQKLMNINGSVLPITSCDVQLMIDGYYYYGLKLLTRINIDNTTTSGIYKNNNGFPVAVKSIEIDSGTMRVSLKCDNQQSDTELKEIDDKFPDYESDEYQFDEELVKQYEKFDYGRYESVE